MKTDRFVSGLNDIPKVHFYFETFMQKKNPGVMNLFVLIINEFKNLDFARIGVGHQVKFHPGALIQAKFNVSVLHAGGIRKHFCNKDRWMSNEAI